VGASRLGIALELAVRHLGLLQRMVLAITRYQRNEVLNFATQNFGSS